MRHLSLHQGRFTDAGMVYLRGMQKLAILELNGSLITNDALANLGDFPHLGTLDLCRNQNLTDAAAVHLRKLKGLKRLRVGPEITKAGAFELSNDLTQCQVEHVDADGIIEHIPPGEE
jgi:hypothetical protein